MTRSPRRIPVPLAAALCCAVLAGALPAAAQEVASSEYERRRARLMDALPDGITLIHARSGPKEEDQPSFIQDASFYYFTGLENHPGAVLAVDGPRRASLLFVPPPPSSFGYPVPGLVLEPSAEAARRLGVFAVLPWDDLDPWLRQRLTADVTLYLDESRRPEPTGAPPGFRPVAGPRTLWRLAVSEAFPEARIASAEPAIRRLRWVKAPGEVARLRSNAVATAAALLAASRTVRPGVSQREAELAVVGECVAQGAQGPSFWPWIMSGPNAHVDHLVRAFYDYEHLDRTMLAGELVRVDIGCGGRSYGGDVGRTIPVSGRFSPEQAEVWDLLVAGYRAGLDAMRPGVSLDDVRDAARAGVRLMAPSLNAAGARDAAALLDDRSVWHIHGVGIESGEATMDTLAVGTVIAFEPMIELGADAFYLEDMILVMEDGAEVLSAGLPYAAAEVEAVMR